MTEKIKKVLVSVPEPLLKKVEVAARKSARNRSAEICVRLSESLKGQRQAQKAVG